MDKDLAQFLWTYHNGTCIRAYEYLGCHPETRNGQPGYVFRVWAPRAAGVSVTGAFNFWNTEDLPMERISQGIWEAFSVYARPGQPYKYYIRHGDGSATYKSDPVGFAMTRLPDTSSLVPEAEEYRWHDAKWLAESAKKDILRSPVNIYEMHLGSWRRKDSGVCYSYRELAECLPQYVKDMGYTHVELMPISEYPYDPSWGYQVTGYFAPTARYGGPRDFMYLVDSLHRAGVGVILDWVPAHFPKDENGLFEFDGTCTYELSDPMMNEHPDWTTRIFDFGKPEVKSFLVSNAVYWLEKFHVDGLRVDAVSSMLYLDYNRQQYKPNRFGGKENLEAIELLRAVNRAAFQVRPEAIMIAEESTAWPMVTKPDFDGGLGFLFKWNMGWMNDTLQYMSEDPLFRKYRHNNLTFSMTYAFSENFILPLSHDEVVHGKKSLIDKMPGEYDQKFSNLRALYMYMMSHPGKKLLFMGSEFAQFVEWRYAEQLDWLLLGYDRHRQMQEFVRDLNHLYLKSAPLWQNDMDWNGFQWVEPDAGDVSILAYRRIDNRNREILAVCNFTPVARHSYRLGVPRPGLYAPLLNSDEEKYGGTGMEVPAVKAERVNFRDYKYSACFEIPPMSCVYYVRKTPKKSK